MREQQLDDVINLALTMRKQFDDIMTMRKQLDDLIHLALMTEKERSDHQHAADVEYLRACRLAAVEDDDFLGATTQLEGSTPTPAQPVVLRFPSPTHTSMSE